MTILEVLSKIDISKPTVFIMRGLPGSGKSAAAQEIKDSIYAKIASADDYWISTSGEYKFDITQVPNNHHWCLRQFLYYLEETEDPIIVDNTNTSLSEFSHYVKIAQAFDCQVVIVDFVCSIEDSLKRNTHNVPEATIKKMSARFLDSFDRVESFCKTEKLQHFVVDTHSNKC